MCHWKSPKHWLLSYLTDKVKVSESGIDSVQAILDLRTHGFEGFLDGTEFHAKQST